MAPVSVDVSAAVAPKEAPARIAAIAYEIFEFMF
jgi:hypothetical protein